MGMAFESPRRSTAPELGERQSERENLVKLSQAFVADRIMTRRRMGDAVTHIDSVRP